MARKVIQVVSTYEVNGQKKFRNTTVGSAFTYENGDIKLVLDPGVSIFAAEGVNIVVRDPLPKRDGGGGY